MWERYVLPAAFVAAVAALGLGVLRFAARPRDPATERGAIFKVDEEFAKRAQSKDRPMHGGPLAWIPGGHVGLMVVRGDLPMHLHRRRSEIIYVVDGTAKFLLGEKTHDLRPGDLLVIPVGTPHGFLGAVELRLITSDVGEFLSADVEPVP